MTYIEREALLKALSEEREYFEDAYNATNYEEYRGRLDGIQYAIGALVSIPAADVVPVKHGKWIPKPVMIRCFYAKNHYCSECKSENEATCNYCPNCGVKMLEE